MFHGAGKKYQHPKRDLNMLETNPAPLRIMGAYER